MSVSKLTGKQKIFVDEYLIDLNGTRAYMVAYPSVKKESTAAVCAVKLLRNTNVAAYLQERQKALQERTAISQDKVLLELARIAFSNGTDFAKVVTSTVKRSRWNNETQEPEEYDCEEQYVELIDTDRLHPDKKSAITSIKNGKHGIEVASADKVKALELLGKHLGMFKVEFDGKLDVNNNNPFAGFTTEELKKVISGDG